MLEKSLGERHVAVTSDKGSAASGGRWQEQIMCGASLFEKPPASIHGEAIGLIDVLCMYIVVIP
jgi:hypothetical protein